MKNGENSSENRNSMSLVRQTRKQRGEQGGQILPFVAVSLFVLLGFFGVTIDLGRVYVAKNQLQASTNAAAMAGGEALAQITGPSAVTVATTFSSVSGDDNAHANMSVSMVTGYPQLACSTTLSTVYDLLCVPPLNPANGTTAVNNIIVGQKATVNTMFLSFVGKHTITLTAFATASMKGVSTGPFNVAMIIDTTLSMNQSGGGSCTGSSITCALAGAQTMLNDLSPCPANQLTCTGPTTANSTGCDGVTGTGAGNCGGANILNPVDRVALYAFPPVSTTGNAGEWCGTGTVSTVAYPTLVPTATAPSYTYQVVNYSSDYRTSDTATTLNTSSDLVKAVGATSTSSHCLKVIGGPGTYYAQAIYQAQSDLAALYAANKNTQNVLIILSDGDATADAVQNDFSVTNCSGTGATPCTTPYSVTPPKNFKTLFSTTGTQGTGAYMSVFYQCGQAINAALAATAAGTRVYSVAFGSESTGCSGDNTACVGGRNPGNTTNCVPTGLGTTETFTLPSGSTLASTVSVTPCVTMRYMASSPSTFFSTATGTDTTCTSGARPTTNLNEIFTEIAHDLTVSRLIPNSWN